MPPTHIRCDRCDGDGYTQTWHATDEEDGYTYEEIPCYFCEGFGSIYGAIYFPYDDTDSK